MSDIFFNNPFAGFNVTEHIMPILVEDKNATPQDVSALLQLTDKVDWIPFNDEDHGWIVISPLRVISDTKEVTRILIVEDILNDSIVKIETCFDNKDMIETGSVLYIDGSDNPCSDIKTVSRILTSMRRIDKVECLPLYIHCAEFQRAKKFSRPVSRLTETEIQEIQSFKTKYAQLA